MKVPAHFWLGLALLDVVQVGLLYVVWAATRVVRKGWGLYRSGA